MTAHCKPLVWGLLLIELVLLAAGATVAATRNPKQVVSVSIPKNLVRITIAHGCPRKITGFDGVFNPKARDLRSILVPAGASGGLICRYSPVLGEQAPNVLHGVLYRSVFISGAAAQRLASELDQLAAAATGKRHCPIDIARYDIAVFGFAHRADVDIWYGSTGCIAVTNGFTSRDVGGPFVAFFDRLAPPVLTLRRR